MSQDRKKTVLVTGTSSGAGYAIAKEFHSQGYRVLATARKTESISDLKAIGIETLSLEVHKPESIKALKDEVVRLTGNRLDFLVNNAGKNHTVPALDIEFDEVEYTFQTNVFGVMRMCQAFAPLLIEAQGTIVQIGSVAGFMPYTFGSVYGASKAALLSYSDTLRLELEPFNVKVLTIITGGVQSNIARTDRSLPADSYYLPIDEYYQKRVKHSQESGSMPAAEYARAVVSTATRRNPPRHLWAANMARTIWWAYWIFPRFILENYMRTRFGLTKLKTMWATKRK